jgi:cytochrome c biogenesis protein CcdA/thiol-disulfide isomerase/thioredoxin
MALCFLAFFAGALTLLSPCILPVLPFVLARDDLPVRQGRLPLLVGLVLAFTAVASLGAVAAAWAVHLNQVGRVVALFALAFFSLALMAPSVATWWSGPFVRVGERLARVDTGRPWLTSVLLGSATGLLWVPCAGPVLGVILSTAALLGPSAHTGLLLLSYATGAALAVWAVTRLGSNAIRAMKARWAPRMAGRRVVGAAMLASVVAIASGLDTAVLARIAAPGSNRIESGLLERFVPRVNAADRAGQGEPGQTGPATAPRPGPLPVRSAIDNLAGGTNWLNAGSMDLMSLRGKVVLINFWTYSCINCLRTLPHVRAWAQTYADRGLVVVGVHTPEFAFEKDVGNLTRALRDLKISYPVVQDNDFQIWRAFGNRYWPALYFIDAKGRVRHTQFGEGGHAAAERTIEALLAEAGASSVRDAAPGIAPDTQGVGLGADLSSLRSPEAYLGYQKGHGPRTVGPASADQPVDYRAAGLSLNTWSLEGTWTLKPEYVEAQRPDTQLAMRFHARDANLVMGARPSQAVRFRVTIDGQAPGADHGTDVDAQGNGVVNGARLYQLVRQRGGVRARTVEIRFIDPGVQAYAFTFG